MDQIATPKNDESTPGNPPVLLVCDDLFLIPRLQDAARAAGLSPVVVDSPEAIDAAGDPTPRPVPITEPVEGSDGRLLRAVVDQLPALIVFDVSSTALPWARWIQVLKTSSATRRIPILAFGPHVQEEALERARGLGADRVVTRGQLQAHLAEILRREARPVDPDVVRAGCERPASPQARQGLDALRAGRYFEAHDHLERAILDDPGPDGTVYRCVLHLAVACLHTERGNWRGAQKMLLRMRPWLAPLPDRCRGVDVTTLRRALAVLQSSLDQWHAGDQVPSSPLPPPAIEFAAEAPAT